jgi:hypothetical protein
MKIYLSLKRVPGFEKLSGSAARIKFQQYYLYYLSHWYNWLPFGVLAVPIYMFDWFTRKGFNNYGLTKPSFLVEITGWITVYVIEYVYYSITVYKEFAKYSEKDDSIFH